MGYAWKTIKEQLGDGIESVIHRMTFLKGKTVCTHSMCINEIMFLVSAHLTSVYRIVDGTNPNEGTK